MKHFLMTEEHSRGPMDTSTLDAENVSAWENHKLESELAILGDKESVLVKDHPPVSDRLPDAAYEKSFSLEFTLYEAVLYDCPVPFIFHDLVSSYIETILKTVMVFEVITGAPNLTRVYNNLAGKFMDEVANFTGHQALVNLQFDHKSQMSRILILSSFVSGDPMAFMSIAVQQKSSTAS
ncbi:Uncharacterized protein BM_BM11016 [Brugia malayi]|uniref:Uncharacterized protein n=1 Tax=Brugia malayi TaxID=6279 RepID=A0A4E9ERV1_BRUMA|nr:Uncharacterized protein BM_BM11016 [Brugia malayi]VIO86722.1 Uncharacterized protein BM_BM11016 [Brugia malayi]